MKLVKNILLLAFFIGAATLFTFTANCQTEELKLHKITEHVYTITRAGGNITFLATEEGVLVVDSGIGLLGSSQCKKIVAKIHEVTDKPIKYLIFTHYHSDHVFGSQYFPPSTAVISHINTRENMKNIYRDNTAPLNLENPANFFPQLIKKLEQRVEKLKAEKSPELEEIQKELEKRKKQWEDFKQLKFLFPTITFKETSTIYLSDKEVKLLYMGPGHTNGDILVYFPEEKAIHIGDLLFLNNWPPRLDGDAGASAENWIKIFEKVAEMDVDIVIPGHGEITDKEGFKKSILVPIEYLKDLKTEVEMLVSQGASLEEIKEKLKLPKYQHLELHEMLLPYNIEGVYKEIMTNKKSK